MLQKVLITVNFYNETNCVENLSLDLKRRTSFLDDDKWEDIFAQDILAEEFNSDKPDPAETNTILFLNFVYYQSLIFTQG